MIPYGEDEIETEEVAKSLGVTLDSKLSMIKFIQDKCSSCYFHLRNLGRIKRSLSVGMRQGRIFIAVVAVPRNFHKITQYREIPGSVHNLA